MVAYENARLYTQVRELATIDGLTNVANRRHFFELAASDLAAIRLRESIAPVAAMMIDIDRFKRVNDEYGHQVGDEVIRAVAGRLRQAVPGGDLLGRYGGEEFALLVRADAVESTRIAERLRLAVADSPVRTSVGDLRVTISIGVTHLRETDGNATGENLLGILLGRADKCLYLAKNSGRNRVHIG
jgi:diguanylate cyclase (GGDEF)-like protein